MLSIGIRRCYFVVESGKRQSLIAVWTYLQQVEGIESESKVASLRLEAAALSHVY